MFIDWKLCLTHLFPEFGSMKGRLGSQRGVQVSVCVVIKTASVVPVGAIAKVLLAIRVCKISGMLCLTNMYSASSTHGSKW